MGEKYLGDNFKYYEAIDGYFVDFLREPPEPTGDEPDDFIFEAPKVYEQILRYNILMKLYGLVYLFFFIA